MTASDIGHAISMALVSCGLVVAIIVYAAVITGVIE